MWYNDGDTSSTSQRIVQMTYDGLGRRLRKSTANVGDGYVYKSDVGSLKPVIAGTHTDALRAGSMSLTRTSLLRTPSADRSNLEQLRLFNEIKRSTIAVEPSFA